MTDEDVFHEAMLSNGGRAGHTPGPGSAYWPIFKDIAKKMIDSQRQFMPRMPEVYFDFIINPDVNAIAFKAEDRYFIGVFAGATYLLDVVFSRMLADRRILPGVGDILLESEEQQSLSGLTLNAEEAHVGGIRPVLPRCPMRQWYKDRLFLWAFRFIVAHELAHIYDGHVDYITQLDNVPFLLELGWTGRSETDFLTRQSLEVIADSQASGVLMDNARFNCKDNFYTVTLEQVVFSVVFAFCSFFRLFGDATFADRELTKAYPPFRLRQMLCLTMAVEVIKSWGIESSESCLAALRDAVDDVELAFSMLIGTAPDVDGLRQAVGSAGTEYGEKLTQHRKTVTIPALSKFVFHDFSNEAIVRFAASTDDHTGNRPHA